DDLPLAVGIAVAQSAGEGLFGEVDLPAELGVEFGGHRDAVDGGGEVEIAGVETRAHEVVGREADIFAHIAVGVGAIEAGAGLDGGDGGLDAGVGFHGLVVFIIAQKVELIVHALHQRFGFGGQERIHLLAAFTVIPVPSGAGRFFFVAVPVVLIVVRIVLDTG